MSPGTVDDLLKLSPSERAELAMVLWESLDDAQREAELALTPAQATEFDRRLAEHLADPSTAISWEEVRRGSMSGCELTAGISTRGASRGG